MLVGGYQEKLAKLKKMEPENISNFKIRPVLEQDREEVMTILAGSLSQQYLPMMTDEFNHAVAGGYLGFVAVNKFHSSEDSSEDACERVVGYACARRIVETYKLETIAVDSNMRGKNIGSLLIDRVSNCLAESGVQVLNVDTDVTDSEVVRFYLRNGFNVSGMVLSEYMPGITQVHLSKDLSHLATEKS